MRTAHRIATGAWHYSRPLRRRLYQLGVPGAAGALLIVAAGVAAIGVALITPEPASVTPDAAVTPAAVTAAPAGDVLTRSHEVDQAIRSLFDTAAAQQLELLEGEYRLSTSPDPRYRTYSIVMPLRGSYSTVRTFLAGCLRSNPRLALDAIELRREQIGDEGLVARVKFSLFVSPQ